jgi:hypothetical protein
METWRASSFLPERGLYPREGRRLHVILRAKLLQQDTVFIPIFFGSVLHFPVPYAIIKGEIKLQKSNFNEGVAHGYPKAESLGRAAAGHGKTE